MTKRKWRRGPPILSLDELARQEVVCWWDKPTARGWEYDRGFGGVDDVIDWYEDALAY